VARISRLTSSGVAVGSGVEVAAWVGEGSGVDEEARGVGVDDGLSELHATMSTRGTRTKPSI